MSAAADLCTCGHPREQHMYPSQAWFDGETDDHPKKFDGECPICKCTHFTRRISNAEVNRGVT